MSRLVRNLGIALAVSVLLNAFLVGLWAGRAMKTGMWRAHEPAENDMGPMRGVWRNRDALLRPRGEAVDAARRSVREALVAEPFDPAALESALGGLRAQTDSAQLALHRALVDAARELGPDERRRLADSRWFFGRGPRRRPLER
jgi:uncharacterized membrane protein